MDTTYEIHHSLASAAFSASLEGGVTFFALRVALGAGGAFVFLGFASLPRFGLSGASRHIAAILNNI